MRQPDIEIYLKDADQPAVAAWLEQAIAPSSAWQVKGQTLKATVGGIPVTWIAQAVGKWHCLLLESDQTPWADDIACARAAHAALGCEVRCAPGTWVEEEAEEDADRWVSISDQGEKEIIWRTQ